MRTFMRGLPMPRRIVSNRRRGMRRHVTAPRRELRPDAALDVPRRVVARPARSCR